MKNNTWTKGCNMGFTVGHRVWGIPYGWGTVVSIDEHGTYPIRVKFDVMNPNDINSFLPDGRAWNSDSLPSLFHVEQTFDYSSPKWQPEPGELCWVWKDGWQVPNTRIFSYFADDAYWCKTTCGDNEMPYTYCAPFNGGKLPEQFAHLLKGGSDES